MILTVNGEEKSFDSSFLTIHGLLTDLELPIEHLAVEVNREIVPKAQFHDRKLKEGDVIEIVRFVGGG